MSPPSPSRVGGKRIRGCDALPPSTTIYVHFTRANGTQATAVHSRQYNVTVSAAWNAKRLGLTHSEQIDLEQLLRQRAEPAMREREKAISGHKVERPDDCNKENTGPAKRFKTHHERVPDGRSSAHQMCDDDVEMANQGQHAHSLINDDSMAVAPPAPSPGSLASSSPSAAAALTAEPSYLPGWDDATSPNFLLDYGGSEDDEPMLKTPLFRDPTPFPRIKVESDDEDNAALLKDPSSAGIGDEDAGAGELTSSTSSSSLSTPPSSIASSPPSPSSPSQPNVCKDSIKNVRFRIPAKAPASPPSSSGDSPAISFRSLSLIDRIAPLASDHPTNVPTSVATSSKGKDRKKKVPRGHKAGKRSKKSLLERIGPQVE